MLSSAQKGTPRKYRRSATSHSCCRLCSSVEDRSHSKNLFKSNNRELLTLARSLSGEQLLQHENLPELICRACERRLGNFKFFRVKIQESQVRAIQQKTCTTFSICKSCSESRKTRAEFTFRYSVSSYPI